MESLRMSHLIYRFMKGIDDRRCKRLCHIADSKADHGIFEFRIGLLVCFYLLRDIGKQIASRKF